MFVFCVAIEAFLFGKSLLHRIEAGDFEGIIRDPHNGSTLSSVLDWLCGGPSRWRDLQAEASGDLSGSVFGEVLDQVRVDEWWDHTGPSYFGSGMTTSLPSHSMKRTR